MVLIYKHLLLFVRRGQNCLKAAASLKVLPSFQKGLQHPAFVKEQKSIKSSRGKIYVFNMLKCTKIVSLHLPRGYQCFKHFLQINFCTLKLYTHL